MASESATAPSAMYARPPPRSHSASAQIHAAHRKMKRGSVSGAASHGRNSGERANRNAAIAPAIAECAIQEVRTSIGRVANDSAKFTALMTGADTPSIAGYTYEKG